MHRGLIVGVVTALLILAAGAVFFSFGGGAFRTAVTNILGVFEGWYGESLQPGASMAHTWTDAERGLIASLSIDRLPTLLPDPSNAVGDDSDAIALGHALYFDTGLSPDGTVACASCHKPELYFTDGKVKANVRGVDTQRHTPSIVGLAYNDWFYWDGRKDSQWAQALAPQETAIEHGGNRAGHARYVLERYHSQYEAVFGPAPDISDLSRFPFAAGPVEDEATHAAWTAMSEEDQRTINRIFANIGKSIAAYTRRILPGRSRFDDYAAAALVNDQRRMAELFSDEEAEGLRLFSGDAQCANCHNGPLFTNGTFHNIGLPLALGDSFDQGRSLGTLQVVEDEFNCLGAYSDATEEDCIELRFIKIEGEELLGAFKVPSLRNVANTAPYMHNGMFADLDAALRHYNAAPPAFPGHSDLNPLALTEKQSGALKAFLQTLSAPPHAPQELLRPPERENTN